ncbi:MAG: flavodoxin-dependent (E)-4-hydroxy-3-methylbut-2-enyl-diphosphate synthase [Oscillospiraceae bacterium]|nr:flavodoxin-dependent (E)-4-hydroxy-3-methylbut-2-enyl-diphosphate synthase [Oscillospiraceae bacterium]
MSRRLSKQVKVGNIAIGGNAPIAIQSMLNARADDFDGNLKQLKALENAGCEIIRMAVPDMNAVRVLGKLKEYAHVPLVADIHFDYKLALESLNAGVDKIRINPGNIGSADKVFAVADACSLKNVPIRIGVNSGSVEKDLLEKFGGAAPEAMAESAFRHVKLLEDCDFYNTVISIKSSDVSNMVKAYSLVAERCDYPLHLGVTEAGTERSALIKSSIGIGSLLLNGIGDTVRVSITDDPVKEVYAARDILKALNIRVETPQIVSCPTCGRTRIDLVSLANQVEEAVKIIKKPIKIAVMGCVVNGPGEAKEADIGVAGGDGVGVIFKKGEILKKVPEGEIVKELLCEIEKL